MSNYIVSLRPYSKLVKVLEKVLSVYGITSKDEITIQPVPFGEFTIMPAEDHSIRKVPIKTLKKLGIEIAPTRLIDSDEDGIRIEVGRAGWTAWATKVSIYYNHRPDRLMPDNVRPLAEKDVNFSALKTWTNTWIRSLSLSKFWSIAK